MKTIYVWTGEYRPPKEGEWFLFQSRPSRAEFNYGDWENCDRFILRKEIEGKDIEHCPKCGSDDIYYDRSVRTDQNGNEEQVRYCNECKVQITHLKRQQIEEE